MSTSLSLHRTCIPAITSWNSIFFPICGQMYSSWKAVLSISALSRFTLSLPCDLLLVRIIMVKIFAGSCWSALYGRVTLYFSLYALQTYSQLLRTEEILKPVGLNCYQYKNTPLILLKPGGFCLWSEILYITYGPEQDV